MPNRSPNWSPKPRDSTVSTVGFPSGHANGPVFRSSLSRSLMKKLRNSKPQQTTDDRRPRRRRRLKRRGRGMDLPGVWTSKTTYDVHPVVEVPPQKIHTHMIPHMKTSRRRRCAAILFSAELDLQPRVSAWFKHHPAALRSPGSMSSGCRTTPSMRHACHACPVDACSLNFLRSLRRYMLLARAASA